MQRVSPGDPFPASATGKAWRDKFKQRFNGPRNLRAGGACRTLAIRATGLDFWELITSIERLWLAGSLPIQDGLYRADGSAYGVQVDSSVEGGLKILGPFGLEGFLSRHPDMVTSIDITLEKPLPHWMGYLCCGEGSYGSEGFFGQLDEQKNLVWVVYLENSSPFVDVSVSNDTATFTSSAGTLIAVNLGAREFGTGSAEPAG